MNKLGVEGGQYQEQVGLGRSNKLACVRIE